MPFVSAIDLPSPARAAPGAGRVGLWTVHHHRVVASTNPLAAFLPAWHAVRADQQTRGVGRTGRHWVSDLGGLWLSAVLPTPGPRKAWSILPLAVGWAVISALRELGLRDVRLRWPNDLMVGPRKLAGILVETHQPATAVVGIGLNVFNSPERDVPELAGQTTSLQQLLPGDYDLGQLTTLLLDALARVQTQIAEGHFAHIAEDLNQSWGDPRPVELWLNPHPSLALRGSFHGIDPEGRIVFQEANGPRRLLSPEQVALLRECEKL